LDHYLVKSKIVLPYSHNIRNSKKEETKYRKNKEYKIQDRGFNAEEYKTSISEKTERENLENIYGNIIESIHGTVKKALRNKERRRNKLWCTEEIDQLVKVLYLKYLNSKSKEDDV